MISFVIPVYRSADSLTELFEQIASVARDNSWEFEVIFVDDCSGDNSWNVIQNLASKNKNILGLQLSRNYGQHSSLLCGIREARGDIIVTLDDDLQHPPEELPKLVSKLGDEIDVVYGTPEKEQHGLVRDLASQITKLALEASIGATNARNVSALRAFKTRLRDAFSEYRSPTVNIDVLLTWGTTKFSAVTVSHRPRKYGSSGYATRKLVLHAFNMLTGFSTLPLKLASLIGFVFSVVGLLVLAYVLISWLVKGTAVPGFAFLASIIAVFSGAQLLALGIIGEYLARMYLRSMEQPCYTIKGKSKT